VLAEHLNAALAAGTRAQWEDRFNQAGVPAGPVQTVGEALTHPQSAAMDMVVEAATPDGGKVPMIGLPLHFDGRNRPALTAAPRFGADTTQVLLEQGFSPQEVDRLIRVRAVCQG
jgi:crotonobetainyl-CoA:carnitine CoA-transferase CaiB-like acyl-CoA transferase